MPPHSVVLSFIGACLLWVGWFGFNAGSALAAGSLATSAFVATHFAAAAAALGWAGAEWIRNGKPSVLGAISGAVAGLVAITPAAGFVKPMPALLIGLIAGVFCYLMVAKVKAQVRLRRFARCLRRSRRGRHAGSAADRRLRGQRRQSDLQGCAGQHVWPPGLIEGNAHQLLNQLVGVAIAWVLAIVGTLVDSEAGGCDDRLASFRGGRSAGPGSLPARRRGILLGSVGVRLARVCSWQLKPRCRFAEQDLQTS